MGPFKFIKLVTRRDKNTQHSKFHKLSTQKKHTQQNTFSNQQSHIKTLDIREAQQLAI